MKHNGGNRRGQQQQGRRADGGDQAHDERARTHGKRRAEHGEHGQGNGVRAGQQSMRNSQHGVRSGQQSVRDARQSVRDGESPGERVARAFSGRSERERTSGVRERERTSRDFARTPHGSTEAPLEQARRQALVRVQTNADDGAHLFGVQPVLEALRAGARPVERVVVAEGAHESRLREILEIARYADIPVRRVPRAELQRMAAGANHQGVVATIAAAHYTPTDELLDALAARVGTQDQPLAVVLDGVEDPRNLGAIIRTVECAGAHGVFVPERRAAGLTETVAKAAAGALEYVPVARASNVVRLLEELKKRGVWTVGTAAGAETSYAEWDWTQPCALLLGGEGEGLRRLVRERCDVLVQIPLRGRIESLNVSVAAGIVLYEALRQRTARSRAAYNESEVINDE
ncbi:MAG: rRNA (guanosine2251-2-O)-methyltransferase [Acidobacteriota bacterium]|nr:rRNA (guanosine2251-2-O)-methyltransferase [Acidobacteriota bacterium]